ncbi:Hypothetical protein NGAL_HAMBI2427_26460 [Neorhizobium galegae bv. orientalis]|nr:Hypothetical protein NGAL_HAMBI2427_26460 [Neorhizobium galegae bv. orientalis]
MSSKMTEGGGDAAENAVAEEYAEQAPLCPAGHLPLKGGDRKEAPFCLMLA